MSHPLDGCFERVGHAKALFDAFNRGIKASEQLDTYPPGTFPIEPNLDLERKLLELCAAVDLELPLGLGIIFGDANHNLHAALDNLAYELGVLNGKKPGYDSAFPILNEPNEWFQDATLRALACIGPHERALIESHQPFMRRNGVEPRHQVLTRIKRYSNESKHRVVTPLAAISTGLVVERIEAPGINVIGAHDAIEKPFRKGAVMARFDIEITGDPDGQVHMKGEVPWYPAIDGEHAGAFLALAHDYVHDLLVEFADAFFGGSPPHPTHRADAPEDPGSPGPTLRG